jgi:hypothetical protein
MRHILFALVLEGCFNPSFSNNLTPCSTNIDCPPGLFCAANHTCWADNQSPFGNDGGVDGAGDFGGAGDMACDIIYVSTSTGSSNNSGCSPDAPLDTITSALAKSASQVHVCAGTYLENITVTTGVALSGAYDCAGWKQDYTDTNRRTTITGTHAVVLDHANASLDGFVVSQPSTNDGLPTVLVNDARSVTNCNIQGNTTASAASCGLQIAGGNADISSNVIDGGNGTVAQTGSIGVLVTGGKPHIHGNTISGGSGSGGMPAGSVAVVLQGGGPFNQTNGNALEQNDIRGGSGKCTSSSGNAGSLGVYVVSPVAVDLVSNVINGGTGTGLYSMGVFATTTGAVNLLANRVFAGQTNYGCIGIQVTPPTGGTPGPVQIVNNMIHGGYSPGATIGWVTAVWIGVTGTRVVHNTIFTGTTVFDMSQVVDAIQVNPGATGVVIENNILAGGYNESPSNFIAVLTYGAVASNSILQSFRNNAILSTQSSSTPTAVLVEGGGTRFSTIAAAETECGSTIAGGNFMVTDTCGSATACAQYSGGDAPASIFTHWDESVPPGTTALLDPAEGWQLDAATTPCPMLASTLDDSARVSIDFYGKPRTSLPSMGAVENDSNPGCH